MAYLGKSPSLGVRNRYYFTASGSETSISGALTGGTLTFSDGAYVDVMLNGVTLVAGTDYNTTTANTIAGLTALVASDVVEIIVYDVFSVFGGNMAADLKFGDNVKSIYGAGSDLQIYHDGTDSHIDVTGALTVDVSGDINLDAGGGDVLFKDDGTAVGYLSNSSTDLLLGVSTSDKDLYIQGNDGGSTINALHLDMSAAGYATFNAGGSFASTLSAPSVFGKTDTDTGIAFDNGTNILQLYTANTERARIDSSGNVGIDFTPKTMHANVTSSLNVGSGTVFQRTKDTYLASNTYYNASDAGTSIASGYGLSYYQNVTNGAHQWLTSAASASSADAAHSFTIPMTITSAGNVGIGTASPGATLQVEASTNSPMIIKSTNGSGGYVEYQLGNSAALIGYLGNSAALVASGTAGDFAIRAQNNFVVSTNGTTQRLKIDSSGNAVFSGSISKASGSFKIQHPLEAKKDTHHLVHSFVEGPQADNMYRGKVALIDGTATQNIDTVAGMTEGTFVALNREVQCFTTNETGWTAVKGSVSGNVLTITAQENTCTDTISWMVIGERKDEHMYDTDWTDDDGKVIVEPEVTEKAVIGNDPLETA